jgi:lipopolysaccharide export system protein LptA
MIRARNQLLTGVVLGLAVFAAAVARPAAQEQPSGGAMQGFAINRDQPVRIESLTLEVRDKIRQATFIGEVKLTQGETTLKCNTLVVFYEDTAIPAGKKGQQGGAQAQKGGGAGSGQQIKRAEAKGDVFVTQKDQTASGENGIYDAKANTITMIGNVVVTQGQSVMRGERMVANLTTGVTRVESAKGRPVEMVTQPSAKDAKDAKGTPPAAPPTPPAKGPSPAKDAKATPTPLAPPPPAKAPPGAPARIN